MSTANASGDVLMDIEDNSFCFFCGKPASKEDKFEKEIYKVVDRNLLGRKVQYQKLKLDVPRCKECSEIHGKGNARALTFLFLGLVAGGVGGYFYEGHYVVGSLVVGVVGWFVGMSMGHSLVRKSGVKDKSDDTLKSYPVAAALLSEGWSFKEPRAY